MYICAVNRCVT